uniref:Synapsin-1-like n=1 Tax=Nicotiana sylvestris TaxID=4096 RepID=A0A1U7VBV4_NICSY
MRGREQMQQDKRATGRGRFGRGQPSRPPCSAPPPARGAPVRPNFSAMPESLYRPPAIQGSSGGPSGQQATAPQGCFECGDLGHMRRYYPRLWGKVVQQGQQPMISALAAPPPSGGGKTIRGHPSGGQVGRDPGGAAPPVARGQGRGWGRAPARGRERGHPRVIPVIPLANPLGGPNIDEKGEVPAAEPTPTDFLTAPGFQEVMSRGGAQSPTPLSPRHAAAVYQTPSTLPADGAHPVVAVAPQPRPAADGEPFRAGPVDGGGPMFLAGQQCYAGEFIPSTGYSGFFQWVYRPLGQQYAAPQGCFECGDLGHMRRYCPRLWVKAVQQGQQPMISALAVPPTSGGGQTIRGRPRGGVQ